MDAIKYGAPVRHRPFVRYPSGHLHASNPTAHSILRFRGLWPHLSDHLAPGGLLSAWVPVLGTPVPDVKMLLRTMAEVFPYITVWHGPWGSSWIVNGSVEPRPPDLELMNRWFADSKVRADLATISIRDPFQLLNYFVMAEDALHDWTMGAEIITDDHTRVDFSVPRSKNSFFGLANHITDYYLVEQMNYKLNWMELATPFCDPKQPVWNQLVNTESSGLSPAEIRRRLAAQHGRLPFGGCVGKAQASWANRLE